MLCVHLLVADCFLLLLSVCYCCFWFVCLCRLLLLCCFMLFLLIVDVLRYDSFVCVFVRVYCFVFFAFVMFAVCRVLFAVALLRVLLPLPLPLC